MSTECWRSSHLPIILGGVFGTLVWVVGLFVFLLCLLKQDLSQGETQKEYGFLFQKYRVQHRRWEVFREFQKVLLVGVKVMVSEDFQPGKNFILLVLLGLLMIIEGKAAVFLTTRLNRINLFSFVVLYVTLVIELIFS